ncbi:MAG TPA: hypothetical protein VHZ33_37740 [Trebonia sp.]|nr:hypothetical protein [Trebonia sp.]
MSSCGFARRRPGLALLAAAVGAVAVTGCATAGTPYASPTSRSASAGSTAAAAAPTAGALPTGSMTPLPAAAGQLTGSQLESVLLPVADFPSGFAADSSGPVTSGGTLTPGPAKYPLASVGCSEFVQHLGSTGFGETAMAADSVIGTNQAYDQVIYQFATASEATAFVAGIQPLAGRCTSFTAPATTSTTARFSLKATAGAAVAGRPAVELVQTGIVSGSRVTLDTLLCASGVDVFAASGVGLGTPAPASPTKEAIIYNLMKRQAAAAVLGG